MQQLVRYLNTHKSQIQIHNIKLKDSEKKITQLKDLFYNNKGVKDLSVKITLKEGAQIIQQKGRPQPIHL